MFELPEETKEMRDAAREFAEEFIAEGAAERDLSHEFPADIVKEMGDQGFFGPFRLRCDSAPLHWFF